MFDSTDIALTSKLIVSVVLIGALLGCETVPVGSRYDGKVSPIENPIALEFEPTGTYDVKIDSTMKMTIWVQILDSRSSQVVSLDQLFVGKLSVRPKGPGYTGQMIFDTITRDITGQETEHLVIGGQHPALSIAFGMNSKGEPHGIEIDPDSEILKHLDEDERLKLNSGVQQIIEHGFSAIPNVTTIDDRTTVEVSVDEIFPNLFSELSGNPEGSGTMLLAVKGSTKLDGRPHSVSDVEGTIEFRDVQYEGTARVGGYLLTDLATGMTSLWETTVVVDTEITGGLGGVKITQSEVGEVRKAQTQ